MHSVIDQTTLAAEYRFGLFQLSTRTGALLRQGRRVRIQSLPLNLLIALVQSPGEVLSQKELQTRLWGERRFLEFDGSLRVAVAKLREALGDDATQPQFIRTVPGSGYQFIAAVEPVLPFALPVSASEAFVKAPSRDEAEKAEKKTRRVLVSWITGVAATLVIGLTLGLVAFNHGRRHVLSSQDKLVIGGFVNQTGETLYDRVLAVALRTELDESPYLDLIPDQKYRRLVKDPPTATEAIDLQACRSLGGRAVLRGSVMHSGPGYQVTLIAFRCADGWRLTAEDVYAGSESTVLSALNTAAEQMRRDLGESEASMKKFNAPLMQTTTNSLAALRAFSLGEEKHLQALEAESIPYYRLAIDLDPQFAMAYARMGTIYFNMGSPSLALPYLQKAFQLRERTTDRERLYITSTYYASGTGETAPAIQAYELWHSLYPRDVTPLNNLAVIYLKLGQPERALEAARTAVQSDPTVIQPHSILAQAYVESEDFADLNALCKDEYYNRTGSSLLHISCLQGAVLQDDVEGMQRQINWSHGKQQESLVLEVQEWQALYHGELNKAERIFNEAEQNAEANNLSEVAAGLNLDQAGLEAELGLNREAIKHADKALRLAPHRAITEAIAAVAFARAGETARAQEEARKAASDAPEDTLLKSAVLASVQSAVLMQQKNAPAALQALEETRPVDFNAFMNLAPAYYRGCAYEKAGQWAQASQEFRQVISHHALAPESLFAALSQLELFHALSMEKDTTAAESVYQQLEGNWRNADATFPPLLQLRKYRRDLERGS